MLSVGRVRGPLRIGVRFANNKVLYTGDQLWYSVRGGALNATERVEICITLEPTDSSFYCEFNRSKPFPFIFDKVVQKAI